MYKQALQSIQGIEIFPLISLTIFVTFFAVMLFLVIRKDKGWADHMAHLPLEDDLDMKKTGVSNG